MSITLAKISQYWQTIQCVLFPWLEEELGELTKKQQNLITVLELIRVEEFIFEDHGVAWRPAKDRTAIARAFVSKAVYNFPTTRALLERLASDVNMRRICGWESKSDIPSESKFSRAFGEFAQTALPTRVHDVLIARMQKERLVGHISRDSTKIEARERPEKKAKTVKKKHKRGRPKKGEERVKKPTRLERQQTMTLEQMLDDLPGKCDVGVKKNSKGYKETWIGYKLHLDVADGQIPISCVLTSASVHDSQVALPLGEMTRERVDSLYDLMDSAYDCPAIHEHSKSLGHVPIIDTNPRRNKALKEELAAEAKRLNLLKFQMPDKQRYNERSTVERVNGRLKDEFGGRFVRVRGQAKVMAHLMFGILALTIDQLVAFVP